jgi:hypothetical protein
MKADMRRWLQNAWRLIANPYAFFEEMIHRADWRPATGVFIALLLLENLGWLLVGRDISIWAQSLILPLVTYPAAVLLIFLVCRLLVRENRPASFFAVWGFGYLPTFLFFSLTLLGHELRRLNAFTIIPNSILLFGLWTFIFLMLLWKLLFLAITLRLAGNLNLKQILLAVVMLGLIVVVYWWAGLSLGLLKVPYI